MKVTYRFCLTANDEVVGKVIAEIHKTLKTVEVLGYVDNEKDGRAINLDINHGYDMNGVLNLGAIIGMMEVKAIQQTSPQISHPLNLN